MCTCQSMHTKFKGKKSYFHIHTLWIPNAQFNPNQIERFAAMIYLFNYFLYNEWNEIACLIIIIAGIVRLMLFSFKFTLEMEIYHENVQIKETNRVLNFFFVFVSQHFFFFFISSCTETIETVKRSVSWSNAYYDKVTVEWWSRVNQIYQSWFNLK